MKMLKVMEIVLNGLAHNCTQIGQNITNVKILVEHMIEYTEYCQLIEILL